MSDHKQLPSNAELHDEAENTPSNTSGNTPFANVLEANMTRRKVMAGSLTAATAAFIAPQANAFSWDRWDHWRRKKDLVGFAPVKISDVVDVTMPTISDDYEYQVLAPWGTPIEPGITNAYEGDPNTRPTAAKPPCKQAWATMVCGSSPGSATWTAHTSTLQNAQRCRYAVYQP